MIDQLIQVSIVMGVAVSSLIFYLASLTVGAAASVLIARKLGVSTQLVRIGAFTKLFVLRIRRGLLFELRLVPLAVTFGLSHRVGGWKRLVSSAGGLVVVAALLYLTLLLQLTVFGVRVPAAGVIITSVRPNMPASELRRGDIVTHVGDFEIFGLNQFGLALERWKGGPREFAVLREGQKVSVMINRPPATETGPATIGIGYGVASELVQVAPWDAAYVTARRLPALSIAWITETLVFGVTPRRGIAAGLTIAFAMLLACLTLFFDTLAQSWCAIWELWHRGRYALEDGFAKRIFHSIGWTGEITFVVVFLGVISWARGWGILELDLSNLLIQRSWFNTGTG